MFPQSSGLQVSRYTGAFAVQAAQYRAAAQVLAAAGGHFTKTWTPEAGVAVDQLARGFASQVLKEGNWASTVEPPIATNWREAGSPNHGCRMPNMGKPDGLPIQKLNKGFPKK